MRTKPKVALTGKSRSGAQSQSEDSCPQCASGPETYTMIKGNYKFDVDLAREIVGDGREALELDTEDVEHAVEWCVIHEPHLAHVDIQYPGIVAHYWYTEPSGETLHGTVLIDGHHRAAKTLQLKVPFYVKVLTEEESLRVTLRSPSMSKESSSAIG